MSLRFKGKNWETTTVKSLSPEKTVPYLLIRDNQGEQGDCLPCPRGHFKHTMSLHNDTGVRDFTRKEEPFVHTVASRVRFKSHMYAYCSVIAC